MYKVAKAEYESIKKALDLESEFLEAELESLRRKRKACYVQRREEIRCRLNEISKTLQLFRSKITLEHEELRAKLRRAALPKLTPVEALALYKDKRDVRLNEWNAKRCSYPLCLSEATHWDDRDGWLGFIEHKECDGGASCFWKCTCGSGYHTTTLSYHVDLNQIPQSLRDRITLTPRSHGNLTWIEFS